MPARPKSMISTSPRPSSMMLAGFRSRCSTPLSCAAASPAQILRAISSALSEGRRPMRRSSDDRSSPSTYSIERKTLALGLADVVHAADVGMRDPARDAHFVAEALERRSSSVCGFGQELQRDGLAQPEVVGAIDLAHAAAAQQRDHAIAFGDDQARRIAALIARGVRRRPRNRTARRRGRIRWRVGASGNHGGSIGLRSGGRLFWSGLPHCAQNGDDCAASEPQVGQCCITELPQTGTAILQREFGRDWRKTVTGQTP